MKKSTPWQFAAIVLVVLAALFVSLNTEHPDWVKKLAFWQPKDQQDIRLHTGLDLQGGIQILLTSDLPEGEEPDADAMEATRAIIEERANSLSLTKATAQIQDERGILVNLPSIRDLNLVLETIQTTALVEFLDGGVTPPQLGSLVETTLGGPPVEEPSTPSRIFETVLSNEDLAGIGLYETGQGEYSFNSTYAVSFGFTQEASPRFAAYTGAHAEEFVCIALDKEVIACATLPKEPLTGGGGSVPTSLSDEKARTVSGVLPYATYGHLPVPLKVVDYGSVEPTLGATMIQRSGVAIAVGVAAALLFLILYHRLPGVLTGLALFIFALLNIALYKVIPLPLTLPSVIGLAVSALVALGGQLAIFERLREEIRMGRPLPRAVENSLARTWLSIRDTHLVLLFISIATWYIGSTAAGDTLYWMGVALLVGALTSLFVTTVVTRTFIRLTFNAAQERLNERRWLLGI